MKGDENMNEIIVGKHINGIALNELEYLLDECGEILRFPNKEYAIYYLKNHGVSDDEIYYLVFIYTNESRKCKCHLCENKDDCYIANKFQRLPKELGGLGLCPKLKENRG